MKKTYLLRDLGCVSCAAKMERSIGKIKGVNSVVINLFNNKMELDADENDFQNILELSKKKIKKIERQVVVEEC